MKTALSLREKQVLVALSKNARLSDRELASRLKTSQPTVTRIRSKLVELGLVDRFVILPNPEKMGLQFFALTFIKTHSPSSAKKMIQWSMEQPSVIFSTEGEGISNHSLVFESFHEDYKDYARVFRLFKEKFAGSVEGVTPFFSDLSSVGKFYHWHSLVEQQASRLPSSVSLAKKPSRSERFRQALEKIPNPLERIPNPLRKGEGKEQKETPSKSEKETIPNPIEETMPSDDS